jgi:hypothetical protein
MQDIEVCSTDCIQQEAFVHTLLQICSFSTRFSFFAGVGRRSPRFSDLSPKRRPHRYLPFTFAYHYCPRLSHQLALAFAEPRAYPFLAKSHPPLQVPSSICRSHSHWFRHPHTRSTAYPRSRTPSHSSHVRRHRSASLSFIKQTRWNSPRSTPSHLTVSPLVHRFLSIIYNSVTR